MKHLIGARGWHRIKSIINKYDEVASISGVGNGEGISRFFEAN